MRQHADFLKPPVHDTLVNLGRRIRRARKARKMSLSQLEQITRIHRSTLGRLERGDPGVSIGGLIVVLEALQVLAEVELLLNRPDRLQHLHSDPPPGVDL